MNEVRLRIVNMAFDVMDINKDGTIDISQLRAKYNPSKHPAVLDGRKTEKQILEEFANTFEEYGAAYGVGTKDGTITIEEFIEYYSNISASIDNDEYFVLMLKNGWNLDATAAATALADTNKGKANEEKKGKTFGGESTESPFKKTMSEVSADHPLVKEIKKVNVEAPYYQQEEQKKVGNAIKENALDQKTDNLMLERFRAAILPRGVRMILGLERQFKVLAKTGELEFEEFQKAIENFRLAIDPKVSSINLLIVRTCLHCSRH
jgi:hypothetical protein